MTMKAIGMILWALSSLVIVAWIVEASTVGQGFVSTYLAPFALGSLIVSALMSMFIGRIPTPLEKAKKACKKLTAKERQQLLAWIAAQYGGEL
jgi:hypothetical protein